MIIDGKEVETIESYKYGNHYW